MERRLNLNGSENELDDYFNQLQTTIDVIKANMPLALLLIGALWAILIVNKLLGYRLNIFGIYPRHPFGLIGIIFHPILHGSFNHLFFNSFPLFVLLTFILAMGMGNFICATVTIIVLSGFALWIFGRKAIHIGASGLIMGYFGYLLLFAYRHPSVLTYVLAFICIYYFGSILLSIFPSEEKTSWEGHLFGLLSGLAAAYLCPFFQT